MRRPPLGPPPPPVISVTRTHARRDRASRARAGAEGDAEEADAIELAPSAGGFRAATLASVGLADGDDDGDGVDDADARARPHGDQKKRSPGRHDAGVVAPERGDAEGDAEEGEGLIDGDETEPPTENASSWQEAASRMLNKLFWTLVALAAFVYVFREDDLWAESARDGDALPKKQPFSYKGYKDARIPDDDIAQFAGGLIGAAPFGTDADGDDADGDDADGDDADARPPAVPHAPTGIAQVDDLWAALDGYAELAAPYDPARGDVPVFWHVPKSGGTTLQDLLVHCLGMVGANEVGAPHARAEGPLEVVALDNGNRVVNVDMSKPEGIAHAKELGFGRSGLADVVLTSWFDQTAAVFDGERKGRCFALLRHPIRRAISLFYYLKDASWEHTYREEFKNMTIEDYAASEYVENNWMVRFLADAQTGVVSERHLYLAKEVLASKCVVGILEEFAPSFKRFNAYFGWNDRDFGGPVAAQDRGTCVGRVMGHPDNAHAHPSHKEGSAVWNLVLEQNQLDMLLYAHALHLFHDVQHDLEGPSTGDKST